MKFSFVIKLLLVFIGIFSSVNAFYNELKLEATIVEGARVDFMNVGRLDESILFSTNNSNGAEITIQDIKGTGEAKLISNGVEMPLPMTYLIFNDPLIIETPIHLDMKKNMLLGVNISIK